MVNHQGCERGPERGRGEGCGEAAGIGQVRLCDRNFTSGCSEAAETGVQIACCNSIGEAVHRPANIARQTEVRDGREDAAEQGKAQQDA